MGQTKGGVRRRDQPLTAGEHGRKKERKDVSDPSGARGPGSKSEKRGTAG